MPPLDMDPRLFARALGTLAVLSAISVAACNSITGADGLIIVGNGDDQSGETDDDDDGSSGETSPGTGAGTTTGTGGTGGHPATTTTTDSTTTTSSSSTTTTTTTDSTTTTTTTTSTPVVTDCEYPAGPTGIDVGDVVSGNLAWQGYAEGAAQSGSVSIQDYLDCDGSKGIHALLIVNSATWCGVCQDEAAEMPSQAASFDSKGIRVITLMVQNQSGAPASLATATSWRDYFGLDAFATCADPNFTFGGSGSVGLPLQILVNPRTMKIVDRIEGFGGYNEVLQLAAQNAN